MNNVDIKNEKILRIRHSLSHIMAQAVIKLFPDTKLGIGPAIDNGFYYDFDTSHHFTPEDLPKIEEEMRRIIKEDQKFERYEMEKEKAISYFKEKGEKYKVELIEEIEDEKVSIYKNGPFEDLCKGPHIERTSEINPKSFKLSSIAGAYWRGSERNPMLQRIYGIAFETEKELNDYLKMLEEAQRRDHRKIGKEMDLFSINELVGPGLVLWHPNGAMIRHQIETFWKEEHLKAGYQFINTPHIGRANLWQTSGHLEFYKDAMYSPMEIDEIEYYVKPMNCPFHIQIYKSATRSYRDLPLRWAELGTVYRFEKAGVLHGLMRVRGFTQDDAHIICTIEQMQEETSKVLSFSLKMLKTFGFEDIKAYIATRPNDAVGEKERWIEAQKSLISAVEKAGIAYEIDEGGGAFYGPKIDLKLKDAIGRQWQTTTIQFDFNLPERFQMEYDGPDGKKHKPYMIHRALLGSLERFFGILIEHFAGHFPTWLSPVQVKILTITNNEQAYAEELYEKMKKEGIRVDIDISPATISSKIKEASLQRPAYVVIVGKKEAEKKTISLRLPGNKNVYDVDVSQFIENVKREIQERSLLRSYK